MGEAGSRRDSATALAMLSDAGLPQGRGPGAKPSHLECLLAMPGCCEKVAYGYFSVSGGASVHRIIDSQNGLGGMGPFKVT